MILLMPLKNESLNGGVQEVCTLGFMCLSSGQLTVMLTAAWVETIFIIPLLELDLHEFLISNEISVANLLKNEYVWLLREIYSRKQEN